MCRCLQKNNAPSADILLQFTSALAKPFPHALTDVANYVSSLFSTGASVPSLSHTLSLSNANHIPSTTSRLISAIPTSFIPPQTPLQRSQAKVNNLLSSLIEENYRGDWLQGYINWYAKDIKNKTEYSDFCQV